MQVTDRLEALERTTRELTERLERVEGAPAGWLAPAPERPPAPALPPRAPAPARLPRPRPGADAADAAAALRRRLATGSLEDLLGGRVLAWAGAAAVLLAIVLFLAIAVSRDWIGETGRTALGAVASLALLAAGVWLHERRGRTDAARAAAAAGVAGLFASVVAAAPVHDLVPVAAALVAAAGVAAAATALAVRWDSPGLAGLGIVGGLLAPLVVGADPEPATLALVWTGGAAAAVVVLRRRWHGLAAATTLVLAPQWIAGVLADGTTTAQALLALVAFGALGAVLAAAPALRRRPDPAAAATATATRGADRVLTRAALLLALGALALGVAGWFALDAAAGAAAADGWLVALAAAHLGAGAALRRRGAGSLGLVVLALGVVVADAALARVLDGVALALAWSALSVASAAVLRAGRRAGTEAALVTTALAAHVLLAIGHALTVGAPPELLDAAAPPLGDAAPGLLGLAAGLFASGALVAGRPDGRRALHALGVAAITYLLAIALDGPALAVAYALEAVVLAPLSVPAAAALTAAAATHVLRFEVPPEALASGLDEPLSAAAALGAAGLAALATARRSPRAVARAWTAGGVAVAALLLASTLLVTAVGPGEQAQAALSTLWALTGVGVLVAGLRRDLAPVRAGALGLLLVALGKVVVIDLATLDAMARVASLTALGLLLLVGAFAWQRLRPSPA